MSGKNLSEQFLSAARWNVLLFPLRLLVGLGASVIYYRNLSMDQVGVLFLLQSLAATVGLYADLGIERTLPRFLPEVEREAGRAGVHKLLTRVIRLKLLVLLVLIAGLAAFSGPIGGALAAHQRRELVELEGRHSRPGLELAAARGLEREIAAKRAVIGELDSKGGLFLGAIGVLLVLGALFDVYMQVLTAYLKQRSWNLITTASTLVQPVLVTAFITAGWGITGVLVGMVVAPLVSVLLAAWQASRASRELVPAVGAGGQETSLDRRFARFAGTNYLMQVATWMYDLQFVVFLSAATLSLTDVARLGFSYKFAKDLLGYVWTPLKGVMVPVLSRVHARREPGALLEAHATLTRIIWLLELPAAVGLLVLVPATVTVFYPKYADTSGLIAVFVVFVFAESLIFVPENVLMVTEQYRPVILSQLLAFLVVPLAWVLLPRYGILGVALAVGTARILSRAVTLVAGRLRLGLTFPLAFGARVGAASLVMGGALALALRLAGGALSAGEKPRGVLVLASLVFLGVAVFVGALRLFGGLHEEERRRLLSLPVPFKGLLERVL
ncbi:MAG: polysaccharide biosynthesis C-terminal domain-containing protein [Vicinamibacteria bacterium]